MVAHNNMTVRAYFYFTLFLLFFFFLSQYICNCSLDQASICPLHAYVRGHLTMPAARSAQRAMHLPCDNCGICLLGSVPCPTAESLAILQVILADWAPKQGHVLALQRPKNQLVIAPWWLRLEGAFPGSCARCESRRPRQMSCLVRPQQRHRLNTSLSAAGLYLPSCGSFSAIAAGEPALWTDVCRLPSCDNAQAPRQNA